MDSVLVDFEGRNLTEEACVVWNASGEWEGKVERWMDALCQERLGICMC